MKKTFELTLDDLVEAVGDLLKKRNELTRAGTIAVWLQVKGAEPTGVKVEFVPR